MSTAGGEENRSGLSLMAEGCKGCGASVRLAAGEVARLVSEYLLEHPGATVNDETFSQRLQACRACPDLTYGTTCRHCGCLVEVRARLAAKTCAAPVPRW